MLALPYGGIRMNGGSTSQSMTTTPLKLAPWSAGGGTVIPTGSQPTDADPAVLGDPANDRLKLATPGVYEIIACISALSGGAADYIFQLRKNVAGTLTAQAEISAESAGGASGRFFVCVMGILTVLRSDAVSVSLGTFADPAAGGFSGAGGAPKSITTVDLTGATISSTGSFTIEYATFTAKRLD